MTDKPHITVKGIGRIRKAPWSFSWCFFVLLFCEQLRIVFHPFDMSKSFGSDVFACG